MTTKSPTFCASPWTFLNIDQTGRVMPCMHSGYELGNLKNNTIQEILAGNKMLDLKHAMSNGHWHDACSWCKQLEETTGSSGRTVRQLSAEVADKIDKDVNYFGLEHMVVNWSNLCNLTCVYCNPETSTAWQSVKKIPINHIKNEHQDLIELAKLHGKNIQGLTLGGGEPLLQKGLVEFLSYLDSQKINIVVTTNLSVEITNNPVYQTLRQWPNVTWMVSFDNADPAKFEYVRNGASWQQLEKNIDTMIADKQSIQAHPAYSIYCALDIDQYYDFCQRKGIDLFWCELTHPWDLDIRRQPKPLRDMAIAEIDKVLAKWQGRSGFALDTLERYRATLVDNSYLFNSDYRIDTLKWHKDMEQQLNKSTTFEELWPELVEVLQ